MSSRSQLDVIGLGTLVAAADRPRQKELPVQVPEGRGGNLSHQVCSGGAVKRHADKKRKRKRKRRLRRLPAREALAHSINQFAARSNLSRPTLYRMMRDGELRFIYVRNRRLIPVTEYGRLGLEMIPAVQGD